MRHLLSYPFIICALLFISLSSCKDHEEKEKEPVSYLEQNAKAFSKELDLSNIQKFQLSPEAEDAISDWVQFSAVKSEIENLEGSSLQRIVNNSDNLVEEIKKMQDSIPEKFDVVPIESRLNVLLTKAKVLQQSANRNKIDTTAIKQGGTELYQAFGYLQIQLNEVFLEGLPDFDINMDRKQDSIRKAKELEKED